MTHAPQSLARASSALLFALCLGVSLFFAERVSAQPAAKADTFARHFNVPDSPAASALGIARSGVTAPSFMRRYAFEAISANNATGFAGEFSPYLLAISMRANPNDRLMSANDYQSSALTRNLARINASFGFTDGGDKADRAALALRWTLINTRDPFNDRQFLNAAAFELGDLENAGCAGRLLLNNLGEDDEDEDSLDDIEEGPVEISAAERAPYAACLKQMAERSASGTSLEFFAVQQWRSEDGGVGNFEGAGAQYSLVLSHGFQDVANIPGRSQLLLALRYGDGVVIEAKNNTLQRRDETAAALRFRAAPGADADLARFNISVEAEWSRHEYIAQPDQEQWTYTAGVEMRVAENTWLGINVQERSGDAVAGDDTVAGVQLRWGLRNETPTAEPRGGGS